MFPKFLTAVFFALALSLIFYSPGVFAQKGTSEAGSSASLTPISIIAQAATSASGVMGDEVGRYLVPRAEDPGARQEQENKRIFLRSRGVKVFTFSNDDDWFVRNGVAVLKNSASEFEGQPVRLVWQLGHFSPRGIEDLVSGHGQILQEESFLEELARILPAS